MARLNAWQAEEGMGRFPGGGGAPGWLVWLAILGAVVLGVQGLFVFFLAGTPNLDIAWPAEQALAAEPSATATAALLPTNTPASTSAPASMGLPARPRARSESLRFPAWPTAEPAPTALPQPTALPDSPPATAESSAPTPTATPIASGPVSPEFLDDYLRKRNSPLTGLGSVFWDQGRRYNVDPRLLVAISGNETGFGRLLTSKHNAFNWFYKGTWDSHFSSWEEGIETVTRGLRKYYLDEGRTSLVLLGAKYGPIGAENDPDNLNVNFIPNVTSLLKALGGDPEHLTFE